MDIGDVRLKSLAVGMSSRVPTNGWGADGVQKRLKLWLAVVMIVLSAFVFITTFGNRYGGRSLLLIPALVPIFGVPFGIIYAVFQLGYCLCLDAKKGILWLLAVWITVAALIPLMKVGVVFRDERTISGLARIITGAACASGIALGIGALKDKL